MTVDRDTERYPELGEKVTVKTNPLVTVGIRYCIAHHGLMEEDMSRCDNAEPLDDSDCDLRELGYLEVRS